MKNIEKMKKAVMKENFHFANWKLFDESINPYARYGIKKKIGKWVITFYYTDPPLSYNGGYCSGGYYIEIYENDVIIFESKTCKQINQIFKQFNKFIKDLKKQLSYFD